MFLDFITKLTEKTIFLNMKALDAFDFSGFSDVLDACPKST